MLLKWDTQVFNVLKARDHHEYSNLNIELKWNLNEVISDFVYVQVRKRVTLIWCWVLDTVPCVH